MFYNHSVEPDGFNFDNKSLIDYTHFFRVRLNNNHKTWKRLQIWNIAKIYEHI